MIQQLESQFPKSRSKKSSDAKILAAATLLSMAILGPLDRVRLVAQANPVLVKSGHLPTQFTTWTQCARFLLKQESKLAMWRGTGTAILMRVASSFIRPSLVLRSPAYIAHQKNKPPLVQLLYALSVTNALIVGCSACLHPFEVVRTRLACDVKLQGGERRYLGAFDVLRKTVAREGLRGFYRGYLVSTLGLVLGFTVPAVVAHAIPVDKQNVGLRIGKVLAEATLGTLIWYAFDSVARRAIVASGEEAVKYRIRTIAQLVRKEGVSSLYRGAGAGVLHCTGFCMIFSTALVWTNLKELFKIVENASIR